MHSGGQVRQHGNLSFARVYQAGHMVPAYQGEAAYRIFMRALFNRDIATGAVDLVKKGFNYSSEGPDSTWRVLSDVLPAPEAECYTLRPDTCKEDVWRKVAEGKVAVKDWIVTGIEEEKKESSVEKKSVDGQSQAVMSGKL